jgi:hypothetical protein
VDIQTPYFDVFRMKHKLMDPRVEGWKGCHQLFRCS